MKVGIQQNIMKSVDGNYILVIIPDMLLDTLLMFFFFFSQSSENHKGQPMFNSNLAFITLLLTIFFLFNLWSQKCIIFFLEYSVITNILMCSYFPALQDSNTMSLSKGQNIYICTASVSINGRKLFCLMGDKV